MMQLQVVLLSVLLVLGIQAEKDIKAPQGAVNVHGGRHGRIINGQQAKSGQFPFQVGVYYRRESGSLFFCGGTLISEQYVLTAASCASGATSFTLYLGGTRLNSIEPGVVTLEVSGSAAIINPDYNPINLNNDIALIRLPFPLEITSQIRPIRLPQRGEIIPVGSELVVSGWGITEHSSSIVKDLLYAYVRSISNPQCAAVYGTSVVIDSTICTLGNPRDGPCSGDSGGPLISLAGEEPTLAGVVSFVHRNGCTSGNPAGYVRVEAQLDFILQIIEPEPVPTLPPDDIYE